MDSALTKVCSKCGGEKPTDEFHRQKHGKFGRSSICKVCNKVKTYAWRAANPGGHAAVQARYRVANPDRVKRSLAAWHEKNPDYERLRAKERYETDPKYRAKIRAWALANPEYVRMYARLYSHRKRANGGRGLTVEFCNRLLKGPCAYCGGVATELDHVVPVSRGGKDEPENVVPACARCNRSKSNRTVEEWLAGKSAPRTKVVTGT